MVLERGCCCLSALEILKPGLYVAEILRIVSLQLFEPGLKFPDFGFQLRRDLWRCLLKLLKELIDDLGKGASVSSFALITGDASLSFSRSSSMIFPVSSFAWISGDASLSCSRGSSMILQRAASVSSFALITGDASLSFSRSF